MRYSQNCPNYRMRSLNPFFVHDQYDRQRACGEPLPVEQAFVLGTVLETEEEGVSSGPDDRTTGRPC